MTTRATTAPMFNTLGRCARCMRLSGIATGLASVAMLAVSSTEWTLLTVFTTVVFIASVSLSIAHAIAFLLRPPPTETCPSCAARRRAWARKHFWRIFKHRLKRWLRGERSAPPRGGSCRNCGQKTPLEVMDEQPPAADGLRHVVENSRQFALIASRLAQPDPTDSWEADMLHYFVYTLRPHADGRPAHALFVARWEDDVPLSASLFLFNDGSDPEVRDLSELLPRH
jgi:hypothetical protein